MRILHTADWHLGHTLCGVSREVEHAAFLDWLLARLAEEEVDALLIAGDVFDSSNPPAAAQAQWYGFLAAARRTAPALEIVAIGGNHDSAARLDAPEPILRDMGVHVVGGYPERSAAGEIDARRLVVPLRGGDGATGAVCAAVPYLRPADLPSVGPPPEVDGGPDPLVEGVRRAYAEVLAAARATRRPGQAIVAMGHLYMTGTTPSDLSERKILGGNLHALPADIFPADVAYAALGHLHLAQTVGGREGVRYSGAPIPLAFSEAAHRPEVRIVDLDGERLAGTRSLEVPASIRLLRVPERGARPPGEVFAALRSLDAAQGMAEEARPLLEVAVLLEAPDPLIRRKVEEALEGRSPRLLKLTVEYAGTGAALADAVPRVSLRDLSLEEVFRRRYARDYEGDPPGALLAAFHEVVEAARAEEAAA